VPEYTQKARKKRKIRIGLFGVYFDGMKKGEYFSTQRIVAGEFCHPLNVPARCKSIHGGACAIL
jgi:hypothetical protein